MVKPKGVDEIVELPPVYEIVFRALFVTLHLYQFNYMVVPYLTRGTMFYGVFTVNVWIVIILLQFAGILFNLNTRYFVCFELVILLLVVSLYIPLLPIFRPLGWLCYGVQCVLEVIKLLTDDTRVPIITNELIISQLCLAILFGMFYELMAGRHCFSPRAWSIIRYLGPVIERETKTPLGIEKTSSDIMTVLSREVYRTHELKRQFSVSRKTGNLGNSESGSRGLKTSEEMAPKIVRNGVIPGTKVKCEMNGSVPSAKTRTSVNTGPRTEYYDVPIVQ